MKKLLLLLTTIVTLLTPVSVYASDNVFMDVKETDWYYNSVQWVEEKGVMSGYSETTFAPNENLTRGQVVSILYRILGSPNHIEYENSFNDVKKTDYYAKAVQWANESHIAYGYGNNQFGADDPVTREQFVSMLYRYTEYLAYDTVPKMVSISHFHDSSEISDYAIFPMEWAYGYNIVTGKNSDFLDPHGLTTRAECASIMSRYAQSYSFIFK